MNKSTLLTISLTALVALVGCDKDTPETTPVQAPQTETAAKPTAKAPLTGDLYTCSILGQYLANSAGLSDLGFTEEEKAAVISGFEAVVTGQTKGVDLRDQKNMASVRELLQKKHEAKSAIESEVNKKLTAEYIEKLKEDPRVRFTESGLGYYIKNPGEFNKPAMEDTVAVNYRGTLIDGTEFDSALDENNPVSFPLAGVIKGFSEGLQLIGKGGEIRLYIPSDLGYGDNTRPGSPIKAGSMLIFDVTMREIYRSGEPAQSQLPEETPPPPPEPEQETE